AVLSQPILSWLLRVYQADLLSEHIVSTLAREPRLGNVSEGHLFRLAESAVMIDKETLKTHLELRQGSVPQCFYVMLRGKCGIFFPHGSSASVEGPVCLVHKQLILGLPLDGEAQLQGDSNEW